LPPSAAANAVTVVVPTLIAGPGLAECLNSLAAQTQPDFQVVVVDNSGKGLVRQGNFPGIAIIEMDHNVGFGAAINAAIASSSTPFIATLNDDALAAPDWLARLLAAIESGPRVGSCASQVRLSATGLLDSAGMLICADGSSKQRGHLRPPAEFPNSETVLLPSASAALYRRAMLEETGGFDGDFFLYCEDTDLGLRAARLGWTCQYAADAVVDHHYSQSAGRVSPLKAYFVERNRIAVAIKNFPFPLLLAVPFAAIVRYFWHLVSLFRGQGAASEFHREGNGGWRLVWFVAKAHLSAIARLPHFWKQRRAIAATARVPDRDFTALLRRFSISPRRVAEL
jgi:GT2 family glycosyltransferase